MTGSKISPANTKPCPESPGRISTRELLKRGALQLCFLAGLAACLFTVTSFMGGIAPVFDATSHFPVQYGFGLFAFAVVQAWIRRWKWTAVFAAAALINLTQFMPLFFGGPTPEQKSASPDLTVMTINVQSQNREHELVRQSITRANPDAFVLSEVNQRWLDEMTPLEKIYPYSIKHPRSDNFGIAFFSKRPLIEPRMEFFVWGKVPSTVASLDAGDRTVTVIGTHPVPPSSRSSALERNQQLKGIGEFIAEHDQPVVLIGDLNATPWNRFYKRLKHDSGMTDSARGFGLQPTWPATWMGKFQQKLRLGSDSPGRFAPTDNFLFRIPIDHCLHSEALVTLDRIVGNPVGSDHLPLIVKLRFR